MITGLFLTWLYIDAPRAYALYARELIFGLYEYFSIERHATTLLAPYRHDAIPLNRLPIRFWAQAMAANLASRAIGATVRLAVIAAGGLAIGIAAVGSVIFLIGWGLLPILLVTSGLYGVALLLKGLG